MLLTLLASWHMQIARFDMKLANEDVGMLAFTSEQIPAPLLLPEMVIHFYSRICSYYSVIHEYESTTYQKTVLHDCSFCCSWFSI